MRPCAAAGPASPARRAPLLLGVPLPQPARGRPAQRRWRSGHDSVRDEPVHLQPVQRQRREHAPRLGRDDPLRGEHQADARALVVGEHRAQARQLAGERVQRVDGLVPGDRGLGAPRGAGEPGEHPAHGPAIRGEQPLDIARQRLGQPQQPKRLGGGPAAAGDDVPASGLGRAPHLRECEQLLHPGQGGELVGASSSTPAPANGAQVALEAAPRVVEQGAGVDVRGETGPTPAPWARRTGSPRGRRRGSARDRCTSPAPCVRTARAAPRWRRRGWPCRRHPFR